MNQKYHIFLYFSIGVGLTVNFNTDRMLDQQAQIPNTICLISMCPNVQREVVNAKFSILHLQ